VRLVAFALTGKQKAKAKMGFEGVWVSFNRTAVESSGAVELILVVGDIPGVE